MRASLVACRDSHVSGVFPDVYESFQRQSDRVDVVVYTRRPQMLRYHSSFRGETFGLRYKESWHKKSQVYFPPECKTAEDIMAEYTGPELLDEERIDILSSLQRLLAARAALTAELGLSEMPTVVVTSEFKDIEGTVQHLGLPLEHAFLYDDNIELVGHPNVITVLPVQSMPEERRGRVLEFLEERLPARLLDTELVEFLLESKPSERAVAMDPSTGDVTWHVPQAKARLEWAVPKLNRAATGGRQQLAAPEMVRTIEGPRNAYPGLFSPVTPDFEGVGAGAGKAEAEKGGVEGGMKGGMEQVTAAAEALRLHLEAVAYRSPA